MLTSGIPFHLIKNEVLFSLWVGFKLLPFSCFNVHILVHDIFLFRYNLISTLYIIYTMSHTFEVNNRKLLIYKWLKIHWIANSSFSTIVFYNANNEWSFNPLSILSETPCFNQCDFLCNDWKVIDMGFSESFILAR